MTTQSQTVNPPEGIAPLPLSHPAPPVLDAAREAELDRMILNAAILNGALEIMPHRLASLAIVPLQMRLVYQVGKRFGYDLDRGHIKDFLATMGVGLTAQWLDGYVQSFFSRLTRRFVGGFLGRLAGQAASSALAFATTYALGQVARRYYAGGRTLGSMQLKDTFSSMLQDGRFMAGRYTGDIAAKARQMNVADILPLATQT
jgi:uncharacterized protein (DUF697 family)